MHVQQYNVINYIAARNHFLQKAADVITKPHMSVMCIIVHKFITRIDSKSWEKQKPN